MRWRGWVWSAMAIFTVAECKGGFEMIYSSLCGLSMIGLWVLVNYGGKVRWI